MNKDSFATTIYDLIVADKTYISYYSYYEGNVLNVYYLGQVIIMAYVALYRAYRPQKFSEVVGQQHIIKTLQNAIQLNKVAHAYLFCGPRGTGKTTLAKIMAKALNCEHGPSIEPCCECDICKGIAKGMISDVVEIDAASNNGVDDVRALRDTVKFLPSSGTGTSIR